MQTLGEILKYRGIKQLDVWRVLKERHGINMSISGINCLCKKEGHWFGKQATIIQEAIKKEYGIYYDGAVWRGGKNYGD